jgi:SAM-dependent methyltransferase
MSENFDTSKKYVEYWEKVYDNKVKFSSIKKTDNLPWNIKTYDKNLEYILNEYNFKNMKVLELGCGLGYDANFLSEKKFKVTAIDISKKAIELAKSIHKNKSINFLCTDFNDLKANEKFDLVYIRGTTIMYEASTKNNGIENILIKIGNILNKNGYFLFLCGNYNDDNIGIARPVKFSISDIEYGSLKYFDIKLVKEIVLEQDKNYGDSLGWLFLLQKKI